MPVKEKNKKPEPRKCVCGKPPVLVSVRGAECTAALIRSTAPEISGLCGRKRNPRPRKNGMPWLRGFPQEGGNVNGKGTLCLHQV